MPLVDMPLSRLKEYEGINPKPADFDEYWERGLKEMNETDPEIELTRSEFQVPNTDCFDLYFNGTRGGKVYAKVLKPKNISKKAPAMLCFHGYSGSSGDWIGYLPYVSMGFVVAAMDVRGQGGKSFDKNPVDGPTQNGHIIRGLSDPDPDNLLFRQIFLDTAMLARIISNMEDVDEARIGAKGGSQGGALTVACAALAPYVKMAAPTFPFLCDYRRVWEMDMAERAYAELKSYFRYFDPCHEHEDEIFTRLGYIDLQFLAKRIKAEMLFGTGLMDNVCPPSTQFSIYNKITSEKNMIIFPDHGHETLPGFEDKKAMFFSKLI